MTKRNTQARRMAGALLAAFICSLVPPVASASDDGVQQCEAHMRRAATRYNIPLGVLYAVGLTETGRKGSLHPYAMNVDGRAVFPTSRVDARRKFDEARAAGAALIDLGCMQVNYRYHGAKFASVDQMLDPRANVEYAARFPSELRNQHVTWTMAVARYHAGPNNHAAHRRYVCRVIANMVASGFGEWTPGARSYCG